MPSIYDAGTLLSLIHGTLMQAILEQESRIAGFKGEVAKSQELHLASLSRDTERLTNSLEKMRAEIKWASRPCILLMYPIFPCQSVACMHALETMRMHVGHLAQHCRVHSAGSEAVVHAMHFLLEADILRSCGRQLHPSSGHWAGVQV